MSTQTQEAESTRGRVLRESSEAAARERARLEAAAGRSRLGAIVHRVPQRARHLGSEEAARSGLRYQPVVWTAIVVAAVAFYFPGRPEPEAGSAAALPPRAATVITPTTTVPVPPPVTPTTVPAPAATFTPPPTFAPPPRSTPPPTSPVAAAADQPLAVRGFGWASSLSGSGVSTAEVPEGTMPVAARLGQLDKASFVRLSGTSTTLTLVEEPSGAREALGPGIVVACPITDAGWAEEPDQSMDAAPAWDAARCVAGVEDDDTWTFDLSGFDDRTGDGGFALVPDASAPPDFQVTFRAT